MTLLAIKITSPWEDLRADRFCEVILGSKRVIATMVEMKTKIEVKNRVMLACIMWLPEKHSMVGK